MYREPILAHGNYIKSVPVNEDDRKMEYDKICRSLKVFLYDQTISGGIKTGDLIHVIIKTYRIKFKREGD